MDASACSVCGKEIRGAEILYTEDALPACAGCSAKREIVRDEGRAAGNLRKAGWSAVGAGVLAFFGPMAMIGVITYLFVAMALVSAIFAIQGLSSGNERFTKYLTAAQRTTTWICAITGIVLAALAVVGVPGLIAVHLLGA